MDRQFRQGDVFFREIKQLPKGAAASSDRVLAKGEVTGHSHKASRLIQVFRTPQEQIFIKGPGQIEHEEHGPIQIPEGIFAVSRQREYEAGAFRQVQD